MTAHFDLAALGMLVAVAETGGFTAASARLGRTQSAISVRIQDLENQLGHKLLERSRRGVTPTDAGERLIAHARRLLAVEREALADLAGETPTGRLRIGVPDDYMDAYLRPLIARFGFAATAFGYAAAALACAAMIGWRWRGHIWSRNAPANATQS